MVCGMASCRRAALGLLLALAVTWGIAPVQAGAELTCNKIPQLAGHFLRKHVTHRTLSEELVRRTGESYLDKLDPSKTLLLRAEADALADSLGSVFEGASKGDCQTLEAIQARIVERYGELENSVQIGRAHV